MGNSVLLCLLLTVHIRITRARTYLKMVPYTKIILALLVILNTAQALPVSQKPDEIEGIAIPVDEAKEFTYELNRDQDLKGSINGGQSGWALEQIAHGVKPDEVISGSRPKRQSDLEASPMAEHLEAPKSTEVEERAPIVNEEYAKRLEGSSIYLALQLAGGKRKSVEHAGGYGRKRSMSENQIGIEAIPEPRQGPVDSAYAQMIAQSSNPMAVLLLAENIKRPKRQAETEIAAEAVEEVEPKTEIVEPAPIVNEAYAKRLEGSAIYLALKLSGGSRKTVDHAGGYGRKKRQAITFEEEAIMQQIFPVQDDINEIEQTASLVIKPKIKAWGETGLVKNNN